MAETIAAPAGPTGPRTPEGKAISSQNATSHGLTSERTVLAHENQEEYNDLLASLANEFDPEGEHESFLVTRMADAEWKIYRARRIENALFELMMSAQDGTVSDVSTEIPGPSRRVVRDSMIEDDKTNSAPEFRMARAMMSRTADPLNALQRYVSSLERSYGRAHRELLQSRKTEKTSAYKAFDAALKRRLDEPPPTQEAFAEIAKASAREDARHFKEQLALRRGLARSAA